MVAWRPTSRKGKTFQAYCHLSHGSLGSQVGSIAVLSLAEHQGSQYADPANVWNLDPTSNIHLKTIDDHANDGKTRLSTYTYTIKQRSKLLPREMQLIRRMET